jgi:hypothetical protein
MHGKIEYPADFCHNYVNKYNFDSLDNNDRIEKTIYKIIEDNSL